ncbi:MAG: ABC transporter permease [Clostridia bacterium]|nr:ABC transporter permease [Clostridia bacterium]
MNNGFYARLAFDNLKKNRKIYLPYILTCIITITMFYIIHSLYMNESILAMHGGAQIQYTLSLGAVIVAIFAIIFLFYTNSFIIKRRKKEFGLFNVLGMEKRHLGAVLIFETLYIGIISIVLGLVFGVLLDRLMYLIIARILRSDYGTGFYISWKSMLITFALFAVIFALIYLYSFIKVRISQPIELLKGENIGEKEPKTRRVMAIVGTVCLLAGYIMAICTKDVVMAIELFFVAVILVILGTYFLFTAGSIALLKWLKKRKKYYYKTNHFTSVSGMTYRMKQNSVGLASICILATMLLVTISTTSSFMIGRDDLIASRFPYDFSAQANATQDANDAMINDIHSLLDDNNLTIKQEVACRYLPIAATQNGNLISMQKDPVAMPFLLVVMTVDNYNNITGEKKTLADTQMILSENKMSYEYDVVKLFGKEYSVKEKVNAFVKDGFLANGTSRLVGGLYAIVADDTELNAIYEQYKLEYGENAGSIQLSYGLNLKGDEQKQVDFFKAFKDILQQKEYNAIIISRAAQADSYMSIYGGLFFLGVYLSVLFLMATILIIYYKQISEGYEDKKRFDIMQKVGMSYAEVKKSINSQILTIFFLPLVTAGIHVAFAFPMINKLLGMVALTNTALFALCSLCCFAIFSIIYVVVYLLTAKVYYRIVKNANKN